MISRSAPTSRAKDMNDADVEEVSRRAGPRSELFNNPSTGGLLSAADHFVAELRLAVVRDPILVENYGAGLCPVFFNCGKTVMALLNVPGNKTRDLRWRNL